MTIEFSCVRARLVAVDDVDTARASCWRVFVFFLAAAARGLSITRTCTPRRWAAMTAPIQGRIGEDEHLDASDFLADRSRRGSGVAASSATISERDAIETPGLSGCRRLQRDEIASRAPGRCRTCGRVSTSRSIVVRPCRRRCSPRFDQINIRTQRCGFAASTNSSRTRLRPAGESSHQTTQRAANVARCDGSSVYSTVTSTGPASARGLPPPGSSQMRAGSNSCFGGGPRR